MAGVQGMGTPEQVTDNLGVAPQAAPQAVDLPQPVVPARKPLNEIFQQTAQRKPLNEIFGQAPVETPSLVDSLVINPLKKAGGQILDAAERFAAPARGAFEAVADQYAETPLMTGYDVAGSALKGAYKGLTDYKSVASPEQVIEKHVPVLGETLKFKLSGAGLAEATGGFLSEEDQADLHIKPSFLLGLATDVALGEAEVSALSKVKTIGKLMRGAASKVTDQYKMVVKGQKPLAPAEEVVANLIKNTNEVSQVNKTATDLLNPAQRNLTDPEIAQIAKETANDPHIRAMNNENGKEMANAILKVGEAESGKKIATTDDIFTAMKEAGSVEGAMLGKHRSQAAEAWGKRPVGTGEFKNFLEENASQFGYGTKDVPVPSTILDANGKPFMTNQTIAVDATPGQIAQNLKIPTAEAKQLKNFLQPIYDKIYNSGGKLTFDEWHVLYKDITKTAVNAFKSKTLDNGYKNFWYDLRAAAGKELRDLTGKALQATNPEAFREYDVFNKNYSILKGAEKELWTMLQNDTVTGSNIIKYLTSDGLAGADKAEAAFKMLQIRNKALANDLTSQWWMHTVNKYTDINPTINRPWGMDFSGLAEEIKSMAGVKGNKNMLDIITGSPQKSDEIKELLKIGDAFQRGFVGAEAKINESLLGRMFYLAKKVDFSKPATYIEPFIANMKRNKNVAKMLADADINKIVQAFPPAERAEALSYVKGVLNK